MDRTALLDLLTRVQAGDLSPDAASRAIAHVTTVELAHVATIDAHRMMRTGLPEAVFGEGKTADQCARIAAELDRLGHPVLVTRLDPSKADAVIAAVPGGRYDVAARLFAKGAGKDSHKLKGHVAVICAGTSDLPWAEEAAITVETIGQPVVRVYDAGVAGLHRLVSKLDALRGAGACIVVAGMEGALASVVGGLVAVPVFAVPAPVGYGASAGGYAALFTMLSSCSPNVATVNIGNGFGAGCLAALTNRADSHGDQA